MVTLNVDLGELPKEPGELYAIAHAVNVACGGHAGDAASMRLACVRARASGARVGAHPSYPDRKNFGRVTIDLPLGELRKVLRAQFVALRDAAHGAGVIVRHVKPHGALYHDANRSPELARALVDAAVEVFGSVAIVGPPKGALAEATNAAGLSFLREGFADRAMNADGTLVPRTEPGAVLANAETAAGQAKTLVSTGQYDTLCVHSDTPGAVDVARAVRAVLEAR